MYEIIPTSTSYEMTEMTRELVPYEEPVFVDSERYEGNEPVTFPLLYGGNKVGQLRFTPKYKNTEVAWSARFYEGKIYHVSCAGYGVSPERAIDAALSRGVKQLRDAANFAVKVGAQIKKHPRRVSLGPAERDPS